MILGKDASCVAPEDVEQYIFGYTVCNDVSAREVQTTHKQWYFGKSLEGFCPLGPCILTADEVAYPPDLRIYATVNGELRQDSRTSYLIHGISEIVSELSYGMTLQAGTILITGTQRAWRWGWTRPASYNPGTGWSAGSKASENWPIPFVEEENADKTHVQRGGDPRDRLRYV